MPFFSKVQISQVKQILLVTIAIVTIFFVFSRVSEGFAMPAEQYVSGNGPFRYTLKQLQEMSGGKKKLSAIEFYDYFEKKDSSGKVVNKGFILQDDPAVGLQNESGGPRITFGNNKVVYASNAPPNRKPRFPILLTDPQMASGIQISNVRGNLGGSTEPPLSVRDAKGRLTAKTQFNLNDLAKEGEGKGKAMKIKFVFSD